jgi:hypothetical protein
MMLSDSIEPGPCLGWLAAQSLELLHRPSNEVFVDAHCKAGPQFEIGKHEQAPPIRQTATTADPTTP